MNRNLRKAYFVALLIALVAAQTSGQQSGSTAETQREEVVRISVRLVQVDGTVTDKQGHQITDLTRDDFQLFVDGVAKKITTFYYVPPQPIVKAEANKKKSKEGPDATQPAITTRLREDQVRRIIVLVVANVSADALRDVKQAMNRFVDEQMQPGDLVSVIRPSEGSGVLQQFTSDKRLLHLAIDGVRWNPIGRVDVTAVPDKDPTKESDDPAAAEATKREAGFYEDILTSSWLRSLELIVKGLEELPGRKSVILFSNGFNLFGQDQQNRRVMAAMHRITDRATRALVVFYTVDARGLQTFSEGASVSGDQLPGVGTSLKSLMDSHRLPPSGPGEKVIKFIREQDALVILAEETGGAFAGFENNVARILGDQKGYYVLGYRPDEETFKVIAGERSYHQIKVALTNSNLKPHFRKGFYGEPDKEPTRTRPVGGQQFIAALTSPFDLSAIGMKLTSLFGHDKKEGSFVRSLLQVDANHLTFSEESDRQVAAMNIFAVAFDQKGVVGTPVGQKYTVRIKNERIAQLKHDGLVYELTTPVERSGLYQVRVVVQDVASGEIGSTSQLVDVPDVMSGQLTLTGLVLSGRVATTPVSEQILAEPPPIMDEADSRAAVRRFRRGMAVDYAFMVLNNRIDQKTNKTHLTTRAMIYRDGQVVYSGPERLLEPDSKTDLQRLVVSGQLNLGALPPGQYVLAVVVTDGLATDLKHQRATRWMDFDIVQ